MYLSLIYWKYIMNVELKKISFYLWYAKKSNNYVPPNVDNFVAIDVQPLAIEYPINRPPLHDDNLNPSTKKCTKKIESWKKNKVWNGLLEQFLSSIGW